VTLSPEAIENWDHQMDRQVEEARKLASHYTVEEIRKHVEHLEQNLPDLPKHSHRFTWEALHPKDKEQ
jgi:hypothetical protein